MFIDKLFAYLSILNHITTIYLFIYQHLTSQQTAQSNNRATLIYKNVQVNSNNNSVLNYAEISIAYLNN